jgi:prepilin-type N-terminal cleavage/methylation domain-containing protein
MDQQISLSATRSSAGFTMVEVLFTLALAGTVASLAIPSGRDAVDELRTAAAARYLSARLSEARMSAVTRSTCIGLRFEADGRDYRFTPYADGNNNGVRSLDIALGLDAPLGAAEKLGDHFPGVSIGLMPGLPDADNDDGTGEDGVRIGASRIETMSANGTATAGTIYLHGRRSQFAVRILGTTGRVRVLHYRPAGGGWIAR